jgi:hypothetical protein
VNTIQLPVPTECKNLNKPKRVSPKGWVKTQFRTKYHLTLINLSLLETISVGLLLKATFKVVISIIQSADTA